MTLRVYRIFPATGRVQEISRATIRPVLLDWAYIEPSPARWPDCLCPSCRTR